MLGGEEKKRKKKREKKYLWRLCISQAATAASGYVPGRRGWRYKARALAPGAALTLHGARQPARLLGTR